ncbi:MAG TPA: NAD(P)H-dependent glycerol-3-phosphate dehydrogenase [Candidatus Polarisedimenticolia bacterium]|nr:NAD(P)H-dependent glycerol-3-phosphate dehydrogenase [Candidatus Polarisedimenticolia bacterium]
MAKPVAVVGAGSWGTALALHLARAGFEVDLWAHDRERVREIESTGENRTYLPDFPLPARIHPSHDLSRVLAGASRIVWVVPARYCRALFAEAAPHLTRGAALIVATKGIEPDTGMRMSEVAAEVMQPAPATIAALGGPGFAREVARGDPTAGVLGIPEAEEGEKLQEALSHGPYRFYTNRDRIGVELGGALKNVIALAAGVVEGLGYGSNTTAALMTRGLSEITRLGVACGGSASTFAGLAGMGDLVLTCTGRLSRNRSVGVKLGEGKTLEQALAGMKMVAEGVPTTTAALLLAKRHGVDMPITTGVAALLQGKITAKDALAQLMQRPLKDEEIWE